MKKSKAVKEDQFSIGKGIVNSLYFLYQEILKENLQELADIIEITIEDCEQGLRKHSAICPQSEDILKEFYVLRKFRGLDKKQKECFFYEIEHFERCMAKDKS